MEEDQGNLLREYINTVGRTCEAMSGACRERKTHRGRTNAS